MPQLEKQEFLLTPRPPFRLDLTAWALKRRRTNAIDLFDGIKYQRAITLPNKNVLAMSAIQQGSLRKPKLIVEIRGRRIGPHELQFARETLNAIFGLQVDLTKFYQSTKHNARVSELVRKFRGVKPPRFPSIFETLVNAISCQQVSVTVGLLLMSRLASIYGRSITLGGETLHTFPTPQDLSRVDPSNLRRLGFSNSKSKYIIGLAKSIVNNDVSLEEGKLGSMNDEDALNYLRSIPGVGRWSSQYVLLRGLGRLHRFPADDLGAQNGLKKLLGLKYRPDYERTIQIIKPWQPFAGMIYFHLLLDRLDREGSFSIRTS